MTVFKHLLHNGFRLTSAEKTVLQYETSSDLSLFQEENVRKEELLCGTRCWSEIFDMFMAQYNVHLHERGELLV